MNSGQKGYRGERQWRDELRTQSYHARRGQQFCGSLDSHAAICDELCWAHFEVIHVNGQLGTVLEIRLDHVLVKAQTGAEIIDKRLVWLYDQQNPTSAAFSRFPLRLAWTMSIHKAQGLTLDTAYLDIRAACEPEQAYVAVSRARTLAGLYLKA